MQPPYILVPVCIRVLDQELVVYVVLRRVRSNYLIYEYYVLVNSLQKFPAHGQARLTDRRV